MPAAWSLSQHNVFTNAISPGVMHRTSGNPEVRYDNTQAPRPRNRHFQPILDEQKLQVAGQSILD